MALVLLAGRRALQQLPHVKHNCAGVNANVLSTEKAARTGWVTAYECLPVG